MRSRIQAAVAVLLILLLVGCRQAPPPNPDAALADRLERLPPLPPEIAATLDPKTNATKLPDPPSPPVKASAPLPHAPCCSIRDQKSLKVKVALTKCGTLKD